MRKSVLFILLIAVTLLLTGCWNKYELPELGFVMGAAIDQLDNGKVGLTVQIYKPQSYEKGQSGGAGGGSSFTNVSASADSIMEAIRNIPSELGRRATWSHMRVIVISEEVLKTTNINKVLDFFYRDNEPRVTASILIAKGKAKNYLQTKPNIEQTTSQQLLNEEKSTQQISAKTIDSTLLSVGMQLKSELGTAVVAYLHPKGKSKSVFTTTGLALLKDGKLAATLNASKAEGLIELLNKYRGGVISVPCAPKGSKHSHGNNSLEILNLQTKVKPSIAKQSVTVHVSTHVDGAIGELECSSVKTQQEEDLFAKQSEEVLSRQMRDTIAYLQENKIDVLDIGNKIYGKNPSLWRKWKPDWDKRFAEITFIVEVKVKIITTGTTTGIPTFGSEWGN